MHRTSIIFVKNCHISQWVWQNIATSVETKLRMIHSLEYMKAIWSVVTKMMLVE